VLKDLNFIEHNEQLDIDPAKKDHVMNILERDSKFLADNNLMDYSLMYIKVTQKQDHEHPLRRMPAMIYV
jgi:hypothetical protein